MEKLPLALKTILVLLIVAAPVAAAEVRGRVVDTSGAPVTDAVVFVQEMPPGVSVPPAPRTIVMDQVDKEFVPHILPIAVGTEVMFPNHDQIHHHVYSFSRTKTFEIPLYKGETANPVVFDTLGAVKLGCNIHDWMSAVILVLPYPYYATTDANGDFVLPNLQPGRYTLAAWHEGSKSKAEETQQTINVDGSNNQATFTLPIVPSRPRPASRGMRGYE